MSLKTNITLLAVLFFGLMAADVYVALRLDNMPLWAAINLADCIVGALLGRALAARHG